MEVPRLGVKSELHLPATATATATATQELNLVVDLHHSSRQRRIVNPLSKARDRTYNLMVPSWIHFRCATTGTPHTHTHMYIYYMAWHAAGIKKYLIQDLVNLGFLWFLYPSGT